MLYPENFEEKIGFAPIRQKLLNYCLSDLGRYYVDRLKFTTSFNKGKKWLGQVAEMKNLLEEDEDFPSDNFHNLLPDFEEISPIGSYCQPLIFTGFACH